jgi:NADH-quinone oxidoreductase subunit M
MNNPPLLTILTAIPFAGALLLVCLGQQRQRLARGLAFLFSLAALGMAGYLWAHFGGGKSEPQFVETHVWIPSIGAKYLLGIDGLGLLMVLLTAIVTPIAILASRSITDKAPLYYSLTLFLQAGLFGTFTALNFVHWFVFWEMGLVPAFFLIKFWGGPKRSGAATQFFIYTMVGSVTLLLSFIAIYLSIGTFDFLELAGKGANGELANAMNAKLGLNFLSRTQLPLVVFAGAFLGFAVKMGLMPFHTWLPSAYAEAPTGTVMLLTGVMSKMGVYGMVRILIPIFPNEMRMIQTPLLWLAVGTIVFSAFAAFAQTDLKRVLAYSSINHLGYCMLGIVAFVTLTGDGPNWNTEKAAAMNGVILQMFNHGLTAPILFCFVGFLEQRGGGLRGIGDFGGLRKVAPVFCGLMGIAMFASLGLPGLNGFVSEFLIFKGSYPLVTWATALSVLGLLVTAVFLLTVLQKVFNGPLNETWSKFADLSWAERWIVLPAIALMFLIGICPQLVIGKINTTVMQMIEQIRF